MQFKFVRKQSERRPTTRRTPPGDPADNPDKTKRHKEIDKQRKNQLQSDSAAPKAAKSRSWGNIISEVERFERGTDLTIKD